MHRADDAYFRRTSTDPPPKDLGVLGGGHWRENDDADAEKPQDERKEWKSKQLDRMLRGGVRTELLKAG